MPSGSVRGRERSFGERAIPESPLTAARVLLVRRYLGGYGKEGIKPTDREICTGNPYLSYGYRDMVRRPPNFGLSDNLW
jgi:hypothetical protein